MYSVKGLLLISLMFIVSTSVFADKGLEKDELEALVTGKTLEGKWIKWNTTYRMYLATSGEFRRIAGTATKEEGRWWINKKGKLCFEKNQKVCRRVKQREDGGYNLYNRKKELMQTIDKILDGNPHKL
jgi:predicted RNA-binding protein (virulence factor B family)